MCTLIALWKCHPSAPLVLALNRDEFLERPTAPAMIWNGADSEKRFVAGKDLRSGGTWFGVGNYVVAALTNHRSSVPSKAGAKSRGCLVVRALESASAEAAANDIKMLPMADFGAFHLLACDSEHMIWITNRSGACESYPVLPGVHILGNYGLDNEDDPVVANLHRALFGVEKMDEAKLTEFLKETLAREGSGWPRVDRGAYGTRNSAILWWGGANPIFLEVDGPLNKSPWMDRSDLLKEL